MTRDARLLAPLLLAAALFLALFGMACLDGSCGEAHFASTVASRAAQAAPAPVWACGSPAEEGPVSAAPLAPSGPRSGAVVVAPVARPAPLRI